jgi:hypothetical protein
MRKALLFSLLLLSAITFSQAPQFLNYQAVARDASGNIITTAIGIKFEILQGSASGTLVYDETNTIIPSSAGIFTTGIGSGSPGFGTFSGINWANGPYFVKVSIDPSGGTSYSTVGTSQLLSVPYALYAKTAGNTQSLTAGSGLTISSGTISNSAPNQTVTISGAIGTYPNFTVTPTPATSITATGSSILVTGSTPNFTIVPTPSLTLSGNLLSIADGNTVTLPTGTTYTSGAGISITSGTVITNSAPNQTVFINGPNVTGAYPNYTITAGSNPNIIGQGVTTVTTAGNNYTIATLPVNMTFAPASGLLSFSPAIGPNTVNISPALSFAAGVLSVGSNTTLLPGSGLWSRPTTTATFLSNTNDFVGIGTNSPSENLEVRSPNASQISAISGSGLGGGISFGTPANHFLGNIVYDVPLAKMSFWTNNVLDQMVIDGNGYVGIGTNSPAEKLQVQSGANTDISIVAAPANRATLNFGVSTNHFLGGISYNSNTDNMTFTSNGIADRLFFEFSGRAGVGTNGPVSELDVNGSLRLNGNRLFFGPVGGINSGYTGIYAMASGDLRLAVFSSGASSNPPFASGGNSMDALTVKINNGFVGIGTTNPANQLHVFSPSGPSYIKAETATSASQNGIIFKNPNREWDIINFPGGSDRISFYDATATQERFTIDGPSGNVGIGNNNPSAKLDVAGMTYFRPNGTDQTKLLVQDQLSGSAMRLYTDALAGSPYDLILGTYPNGHIDQLFLQQSTGFVGVGTNSPATKLHVNGKITMTDGTQGDGKILVSNTNGNASWGKATDFVAINATSCQNIGGVSAAPVMFGTILASFTKLSANSVIEVTYQTDLNVEDLVGSNSVRYELRVSGISGIANSGRANYFLDNNGSFIVASGKSVTMVGIFPTLSAGAYQVQLWASCPFGGSATNVHVDPGCFGGSSVVVKEIR